MVFWKSKNKNNEKNKNDKKELHSEENHPKVAEQGHQHHAGCSHEQKSSASPSPASVSVESIPGVSKIKNIIAIGSGKGGVGKSTVATNLAYALTQSGFKVGLLDADIYGPSQPTLLGSLQERASGMGNNIIPIKKHGLSLVSMGNLIDGDGPVVWRAPMANKVLQQFVKNVLWGELDYLLIDLPPGTGDVQITLCQQLALTGAIIVTTPQDLAAHIAKKGLLMFEQVNVPILGIIENMSAVICSHCGEKSEVFGSGGGQKIADQFKAPFLGSIPLDKELMDASEKGISLFDSTQQSPSLQAILSINDKLLEVIKKQEHSQMEPTEYGIDPRTGNVIINWDAQHQGIFTAYSLRLHCACAHCVDETTGKKILQTAQVPLDIKAQGIQKIGRYGISINFSDSHSTGIYKFEKLKALCECAQCKDQRNKDSLINSSFDV